MLRIPLLTLLVLLSLGLVPCNPQTSTPAADMYGDPLPPGAIARMGTVRWRHGGMSRFVTFLPDGKSVLSVGEDNIIRVWEFPSGKEIRHFGLEETDDPSTSEGRHVRYYRDGLPVAVT